MYEVRVYGKQRRIPWKDTYILLVPGTVRREVDEEIVEYLRKFHQPQQGRGIEITEVKDEKTAEKKSLEKMNKKKLQAEATASGVDFSESDTRRELIQKIRGAR